MEKDLLQSYHRDPRGGGFPRQKRIKLKGYDLVPAQLLNSMGAAGADAVTPNRLEALPIEEAAAVMAWGDQAAAYLTEFYDEPAPRQGIAISRMAELVHRQSKEK